jgi:uncharacterized protein YndB with AHSA1/START domain
VDKPKFVYVTYIQTTPEKLWNALIDGEMTKNYWGLARNVSDWKVGSTWKHVDYEDPGKLKVVGKVVESQPPNRLVLTWGSPKDAADETKHSRVTFEIEPHFGAVRLTVTHDEFQAGADISMYIQGWQAILSSLKTLLETGQAMPMTMRRWGG